MTLGGERRSQRADQEDGGLQQAAADGEVAAADGEVAAADGEVAAADGEVAAADGEVAAADGEVALTAGPVVIELPIPNHLSAVADARRTVDGLLLDEDSADRVRVLVSEIVTNALRHGSPPVNLRLELTAVLRVEVADGSIDMPVLVVDAEDEQHGRGLLIVNELASRWDSERRGTGKVVWFEVDLEPRR